MRVFEILPVQPGERSIGPVADEIRSVIARLDRLSERVRGSGGGRPLLYELKRPTDELEERARLCSGESTCCP